MRAHAISRLRAALEQLPELQNMLATSQCQRIKQIATASHPNDELLQLLTRAIVDNPPVLIRDGGVIAEGYNDELDHWRNLSQGATDVLTAMEERERESTGISTLKIGYNKVHGFYIDISRANSHLVPSHYIRRQTLKITSAILSPSSKSTKIRC